MQAHHFLLSPSKPFITHPKSNRVRYTASAAATLPISTTTMYDLLAVRECAGVDEIKAAFRKMARKLHPDTCRSSEEEKEHMTQQFIKAREAYRVLSDPVLREDYDYRLRNGGMELDEILLRRNIHHHRRKGGFGDWESQLEGLRRRSTSHDTSSSWGRRMRAASAAAAAARRN